jgi:hypothetical protein
MEARETQLHATEQTYRITMKLQSPLPTLYSGKYVNKIEIFIGLPWKKRYSVRRRLLSPVLECGLEWDGEDQSD